MATLDEKFFARNAVVVARELIGASLTLNGTGGTIVETEAYTPSDPASHSFNGVSKRNKSMFGPAGRAYVYRCYGMHWCFNIVCEDASAVLIRALKPERGIEAMQKRRGMDTLKLLCSGPGRLCQALGISNNQDGAILTQAPFALTQGPQSDIAVGVRIGISKAIEQPWRFGLKNSDFLSRKF